MVTGSTPPPSHLPAGQQQVLVHVGAQEAAVAVTLHQVVDVVLEKQHHHINMCMETVQTSCV